MTCTRMDGGRCGLGLYGGRPSPGMCGACPSYDGPMRGAGDVVHAAVKVVTLGVAKPCESCLGRRNWANRVVPFHPKEETVE